MSYIITYWGIDKNRRRFRNMKVVKSKKSKNWANNLPENKALPFIEFDFTIEENPNAK